MHFHLLPVISSLGISRDPDLDCHAHALRLRAALDTCALGRLIKSCSQTYDRISLSGTGPACGQIEAGFGTSFPCDSYGHTTAVADPMDVFNGDYRMQAFAWSTDGCNAANGLLQTRGFPESENQCPDGPNVK